MSNQDYSQPLTKEFDPEETVYDPNLYDEPFIPKELFDSFRCGTYRRSLNILNKLNLHKF